MASKDMMKAELVRETDIHICHQHPQSFSPTLRRTNTLSIWENLKGKEMGLNCGSRAVTRLHKEDDIFRHQKVHVGNCHRWSRHLAAETRGPANPSAVPKRVVQTTERIRCTEHTTADVHLPKVDLGQTEMETYKKDRTKRKIIKREQQETEKTDPEIQNISLEEMCTPAPKEEGKTQQKIQNMCQAWQNYQIDKLDEFDDTDILAEEIIQAAEKPEKDKSVQQGFLKWLSDLLEDSFMKNFAKSCIREAAEDDQIYRTSYMAPSMTRAARKHRKRQKLLRREKQRLKKFLVSYWERCRQQKKLLKVKEEERYEKWMFEHSLHSVPNSLPEQSKKRMSKWEKRSLRAKEFFFH